MQRPSFLIKLGSERIERGGPGDPVWVRASSELGARAGLCEVGLRADGQLELPPGDSFSLSLGYADDLSVVFTGTIDRVSRDLGYTRVVGLNSVVRLQRYRSDKFFENQSCGQMVTDLARSAEVGIGEVQDGIQVPFYAVDSSRSAQEHVRELALRCGYETYVDAEDSLFFGQYQADTPKPFEFGKTIIAVTRLDEETTFGLVHVFGESPSSSKGAESVHWLSKGPVDSVSGEGNALLISDAVVRDTETAKTVSDAVLSSSSSRNTRLELEVVGDATLGLNDTVQVAGMADDRLNGDYQLTGIDHAFSKSGGFTTRLTLSGGPDDG